MRFPALLLIVLALGLAPAVAEETADEAAPWFVEVLPPARALEKLNELMRKVPRAQWSTERTRLAGEYLDAWEASGAKAAADDLQPLYGLYVSAGRYAQAAQVLLPVVGNEEADAEARRRAATALGTLLRSPRTTDALGEDGVAPIVEALTTFLPKVTGEDAGRTRAAIHQALAAHAAALDDTEGEIRHTMLSALEDPGLAAAAGRTLVRALEHTTHDLEGYAVLRASADAIFPVLRGLADRHLAEVEAAGDERALSRAQAVVRLLSDAERPLRMLGEPAPEWTLVKAYGDVTSLAQLKGKVVILDFWATWCPWCVRSFPAMRDLLRDYAGRDLAIVGVTASASTVYDHRYDLDEDMKDKAQPGEHPVPVARKAREGQETGGDPPVLAPDEYREVEQQALGRFIENHEMSWPVVLIDESEPAAKYALTGWPHAVVLDREGRVRYFKVGALLRDRPEAVAAFRKVLDDLLAEGESKAAGR